MIENKIARVCWNAEGWRKPSGPQGKSKNKKLYEYRFGYGHEEWLLDVTKLIDGWHYAYLQPIGLHRHKYIGQTFNVSLYSINDETKGRWWIGHILDVIVISREESKKVYSIYKARGWLKEMKQQLAAVHADSTDFGKIYPESFVVIKYQPNNLQLLDVPLEFPADDPAISASYYVLLNQKQTPKLPVGTNEFIFVPGHKSKKAATKATYHRQSSDIDLVHNNIQTNLYEQFSKKYGKENVGTEQDTVQGSQIDLVVRDSDKKYIFYEIKTSYSVRLCIREAFGQLMEYAFYPKANNAKKLVVLSTNPITPDVKKYLHEIRNRFDVPIYYQRYDPQKKALEEAEF